MEIERIHHIQLAMPAGQEVRARRFYAGLLRLPEVEKPASLASRGGVWFETENIKIHLGVDANFAPAKKAHPALLVRDLAELVRRLRAGGIEVVDDDQLPGYDRVYVSDPFGNRIELLEARR